MPGCGRRFWCYILPAEPARTEQDGKCRSSNAGGSDPQVFSWSYPVSGNKKNNQPTKTQSRLRFLNTIALTSLCRTHCFMEQRTRLLLLLWCPFPMFTAFGHCRNWEGVGMLRLLGQGLFKTLCSTRASLQLRFFLMLSACDPFHSFLQLQNKTWKYI